MPSEKKTGTYISNLAVHLCNRLRTAAKRLPVHADAIDNFTAELYELETANIILGESQKHRLLMPPPGWQPDSNSALLNNCQKGLFTEMSHSIKAFECVCDKKRLLSSSHPI